VAIEVKWGFVLTARKGWGEVASSVIGNVRAERDDRGLVDVAGRMQLFSFRRRKTPRWYC
jgi:hypothetical protein